MEKFWKDGMAPDLPKPVRRVGRIRFYSVDDGVPVTSLGGLYVLRDCVTLIPASNPKQEASQSRLAMPGAGE
ncbi:MAG: hypothetical protein JO033_10090 [Acidobacteriaceae bacterium]|nr:hypothetical protein [Acidobacteriaceae bacterium]